MPPNNLPQADLHVLLLRLLVMRADLVDRLAVKINGGDLALLASVDGAAAAVEAEIDAREAAGDGNGS